MQFQLERLLGTGGIAHVYATADPDIAVKLLKKPHSSEKYQALKNEFDCLKSLQHPKILSVREWINTDEHIGFSMQHLDGFNGKVFAERLQRLPPSERHQKVVSIGVQLLEAIEHIHQNGWIHRDIKPSNLIIQDTTQTVLIDFGTVVPQKLQPRVHGLIGTPRYASPEQIAQQTLLPASDIYSVGTTLYYMLLHQPPFSSRERSQFVYPTLIDPTVPKHLEDLIVQMMSIIPEERGQITDLIHQLTQVRTTVIPLAGREDTLRQVSTTLRRVHNGEQIHLHINGTRGSGKTWLHNLIVQSATQQHLTVSYITENTPMAPIFEQIAKRHALLIVSVSPTLIHLGLPEVHIHIPWLTLAQTRRSIFSNAPRTTQISLMSERLFALTGGLPILLLHYLKKYTVQQTFALPLEPEISHDSWYPVLTSTQISIVQLLSVIPEPCSLEVIHSILALNSDASLEQLKQLSLVQQLDVDWGIANDWTAHQTLKHHPVPNDQIQMWLQQWRNQTKYTHRPIEDIEHLSMIGQLAEAKALGLTILQHIPRSKQAFCLLSLGQVYLDIGLLDNASSVLADATALSKAVEDEETYLRSQALRARVSLEVHNSSPTGAAHALDRLGKLIHTNNPWVLSVWQWACGALGDTKTWNKWFSQTLISIENLSETSKLRCHYSIIRGACALGELHIAEQLLSTGFKISESWPLLYWEYARVQSLLQGNPPPIAGSMVYDLTASEILCFKQRWIRVKGKHPDPTWHH